MKTSIFLCSSMAFYQELVTIEKDLKTKGFEVHIPISAQVMKQNNDFVVANFKDVYTPEEKQKFIRDNFQMIYDTDALLVINNKKNGIPGYIGTNVLMEIGVAFYSGSKIYIWNQIDPRANYQEELSVFDVKYINGDLSKIRK